MIENSIHNFEEERIDSISDKRSSRTKDYLIVFFLLLCFNLSLKKYQIKHSGRKISLKSDREKETTKTNDLLRSIIYE